MKIISRIARTVAAAGFVIAAASLIVHPFGTVKTQDSQRPLFADANLDTSAELSFVRACQNCHSERTVWPWYSYVAPVSWLLERDVRCARAHLNVSRWGEYSVSQRETLLAAIGAAVRNRQMPPRRFTLLHPEALLSAAEAEQIYRWAHAERRRLRHPVQRSAFIARNNELGSPDSAE
jgi:hypothetical protein